MGKRFSIDEYMRILGDELIAAFAQGGLAPSPGTKGGSREKAVRDKLRQLLPSGIGVGTGFAIDSQGFVSLQQDIVLYEDGICPVFRLNESNDASFYPCEGVFAVGEVKSTIGTKEAKDVIEKVASVRRLSRFARTRLPRHMLSPLRFPDGPWPREEIVRTELEREASDLGLRNRLQHYTYATVSGGETRRIL